MTCALCRLNAAEMLIDVERTQQGTETQWLAESGVVDLFVLLGPTPNQVARSCTPGIEMLQKAKEEKVRVIAAK